MADPITLNKLPLAALLNYVEQHLTPDGDTFLLPKSVGPDSITDGSITAAQIAAGTITPDRFAPAVFVPQYVVDRSDSGADVSIPNTGAWQVVSKATGNLGDGQTYTVPSGQTHVVRVSGRVLCSADSSNWTDLGARVSVWNTGTSAFQAHGVTETRGIFYGYNLTGGAGPDWNTLCPEDVFVLPAGAYTFSIEVHADLTTGGFGGKHSRAAGYNLIVGHRIA